MKVLSVLVCWLLISSSAYCWPWGSRTTAPEATYKEMREYDANGVLLRESVESRAKGAGSRNIPGFETGDIKLNEITVGGVTVKYSLPRVADRWMLFVGVGLIVVGVLVFGWFCKAWVLAGLSGVVGVSVIGLAYYPWVAGVTAGLAMLCAIMYAIYSFRRRHISEKTSALLLGSISETSDDVEAEVRRKIMDKAFAHKVDVSKEISRLDRKRVT